MKKIKNPLLLLALGATALCGLASIKIQPKEINSVNAVTVDEYYKNVKTSSREDMYNSLSSIISADFVSISYNGLWEAFKTTDLRSDGKIWDMYSNTSYDPDKDRAGNYSVEGDVFNREHSVPKSWFSEQKPAYSDLFHLYPTDGKVNGMRSNWPFGVVKSATYTSRNGCKLGSSDSSTGISGTVFEPVDEYKGDFARTYFYFATRYTSFAKSMKSEGASVFSSSFPYLSSKFLNLYYQWHINDPVSTKEINRNNAVYTLQKNRNPYIDHPEWADYVFKGIQPTPETKTLEKIEVSGTATTKSYYVGDTFDMSGLTVTATFDDNGSKSTSNVTSSVKVEPASLSLNTEYVTLSYTYNGTTKSTTYSDFTVSERPATNYGTLDNPLGVSDAKLLIGDECPSSGNYTKQQLYVRGEVGSIITDDSTHNRKKIYIRDLNSSSSTMIVESLNMTKEQYNVLQEGDEIIFHGYGCNSNDIYCIKYKDSYDPTLDRNITKEAVIPVDSVTITNTKTDYYIGDTCQINATVLPSNASNKSLTYSSNNTNVATVNNAGEVLFKAAGNVTITASSNNNKTDTITFSVTKRPVPVESIEATLSSTSYYVGETASVIYRVLPTDADNQGVTFASSDTQVATINDEGEVSFLKEGSVTISVISDENTSIRDDINVTVSTRPVEDILIREIIVDNRLSLNVGDNEQISYQIVPSDATDKSVSWSSSNNAIASVDEEGYVTGVAEGNAVITVTANDAGHVSSTINVQVTKPVHIVEVSEIKVPSNISVNIGEDIDVECEVLPENATYKSVSWSSNDETIATVVDGKVTGVSEGNTRIVVSANDDSHVSNVVDVEVKKPVHIVEVSEIKVPSNISVNVGEDIDVECEVLPENATDKSVSWSSNDESIATVVDGKVTGVSEGNTRIVVSANDDSHVSNVVDVEVTKSEQPVVKPVAEISVVKLPDKTTYEIGEDFDKTGLVVNVNYIDGTEENISNQVSLSEVDTSVSGTKTVEITYKTNYKTSFQVIVLEASVISISMEKTPAKMNYFADEPLNIYGLVIKATMSDDSVIANVASMCTYTYDFATSNKVQISFSGKHIDLFVTPENVVQEKPVQHKAADFAYVFIEKFESKEPTSVSQSEWDALQYYYNKLDTASKEFLKNYNVSSNGNGEVSAEVPEVDALKEFATKYDAIYNARKADGFTDFIGRASVQPIPGPTPTPTPSSDNKTLIIVVIVICVVAVAIIAIIIPVEVKRSKRSKKNAQ